MTNHTSYYVNVGQTIGVVGAIILGWRALKVEEAKAGIQQRSVVDILKDDACRIQQWYDKTFGPRMYRHV